jgi:hypothetical protein
MLAVAFAVTRDDSSSADRVGADAPWRDRVITGPTTSAAPTPTPAPAAEIEPASGPLPQLVAQRAVLTDRLAQAVVRDDDAAAAFAEDMLEANTMGLQAAVSRKYGDSAGAAVATGWGDAVAQARAYAESLRAGNSAGATSAKAALATELQKVSAALGAAPEGAGAARPDLSAYASQVVSHVDAYAAKDYTKAYAIEREAYAALYALGDELRDPGKKSSRHQFRSRLRVLLSEHATLAADVMRSGLSGWPEFPAAAAALNANSSQLGSAVEALLGDKAAKEFTPLWAEHVDGLVAYVRGEGAKDTAAKTAAQKRLESSNRALGEFFARFTDGRLSATKLVPGLQAHHEMLLEQIGSVGVDTVSVQARPYLDVAAHAEELADVLAKGINDTVAARSPRGGAETGSAGRRSR